MQKKDDKVGNKTKHKKKKGKESEKEKSKQIRQKSMQFNYIRLVGKCALIVAKLILAISMLITREKKKKKS